tara:strand:- start:323 stop:1267 length:945 start_codon:yes stop_codon:yes gene_type:complete
MYLLKQLWVLIILFLIFISNISPSNALENKILFKIENEIITSIDIYEEIKFLKTFNPGINNLSEPELFEISKNSILRDKIKKIEIMNFVKELKVDEKFLIKLVKKKYSKININSFEEFENFLKVNNLDIVSIKEKFVIELIWNDLIYQKFNKQVIIDKDKIKNEILQNPQNKNHRELLLSEIIFDVKTKNDFDDKYEKILFDIKNLGFKKAAIIHSNSETGTNGGLIGWVKEDNLNKNIKKNISDLEPGMFSNPIRTSSGFIILKVDDKREYVSEFNLEDKLEEVINFQRNKQLEQFSSMYFNKLKKSLIIYGL